MRQMEGGRRAIRERDLVLGLRYMSQRVKEYHSHIKINRKKWEKKLGGRIVEYLYIYKINENINYESKLL
jgi:hypothetical protein